MRRLSGIYGGFSWYKGRHDDDDDDDDCDDDDDDDDDDDKWKKKFRYGSRMSRFYGFPYLPRVYIVGTGEEISITFKSDRIITLKGFDAVYRVLRGNLLSLSIALLWKAYLILLTDLNYELPVSAFKFQQPRSSQP